MLLQANKSFSVFLLLLVVAGANASPTVTTDNMVVPTVQRAHDAPTVIPPNSELIEPIDSKLAEIGRELQAPPVTSAGPAFSASTTGQLSHIKSLPAVPAAILMVLTGFLCVSFVKDRRVWLAALAGLLWLGQAGIQAVPQLALRLSHRNHIGQQASVELTYPCYLENSNRLRSDIEGTRYIGLLHHLAGIPDSTMSFLRKQESRKLTTQLCFQLNRSKNTDSFQSQPAFLSEQYSLNSLFKCLASKAEQFICFSPAFIFEIIPRGPPKLT